MSAAATADGESSAVRKRRAVDRAVEVIGAGVQTATQRFHLAPAIDPGLSHVATGCTRTTARRALLARPAHARGRRCGGVADLVGAAGQPFAGAGWPCGPARFRRRASLRAGSVVPRRVGQSSVSFHDLALGSHRGGVHRGWIGHEGDAAPLAPGLSDDRSPRLARPRIDLQPPVAVQARVAAMQRLPPVAAGGRTHADWNQGVVRPGERRRFEWQLCEIQRP